MNRNQRAHAASNLLRDEVFREAVEAVKADAVKSLLSAKTPEERERRFQEWSAIDRTMKRLANWASNVEVKNDE